MATPDEIKRARKKVKAILVDRWSLDQEDGWDEFGEETLDDIEAAFRPLFEED